MAAPRVLAMIMAGGKGSRLYPLTRNQVKPAVPFGGKFRVIDFVLSNFVNSGYFSLYVLVQYRSLSLIEHLRTGWRTRGMIKDHFISVVPPQMGAGQDRYRGTADALAQNIDIIRYYNPDLVAVFGADHIFRMDVRQMVDFHLESRADATIAAMPVKRAEASRFGVIESEVDGRILSLTEKPESPACIPGLPDMAYASMGNFLFRPSYLFRLLEAVLEDTTSANIDLSAHVLPGEEQRARLFAYNFLQNFVPGAAASEATSYWRDIGAIGSFYAAHMDMLTDPPRLNLDNPRWPIRGSRFNSLPTQLQDVDARRALICEGCDIRKARLSNVVVGRGVRIEPGAEVTDSVLMDLVTVRAGARLNRAIVDTRTLVGEGDVIAPDCQRTALETHIDADAGVIIVPQPESARVLTFEDDMLDVGYY